MNFFIARTIVFASAVFASAAVALSAHGAGKSSPEHIRAVTGKVDGGGS